MLQDNTLSTIVTANSYQWSTDGDQYGYFITGPRSNPDAADQTNKAACVLFKCPGK